MRVVMVDPACFSLPYDHCLCEALVQCGCQVTLARSRFLHTDWNQQPSYAVWEHFYRFTHGRVHWRERSILWKGAKSLEHLLGMRQFVAMLRDIRPDLIHFQWLPVPLLDSYYVASLRQIAPVVLTLHDTSLFHGSPTSRLQALGLSHAWRQFDAILVHTTYSKEQVLRRKWAPAERINVVPHGVLGYYRDLAPRTQGDDEHDSSEKVVLFFGTLKPYKGVDILIRAFAGLSEEPLRSSRLLIVGNPRMDIAPLKELARGLGIESRVEWKLGFLPEEEVGNLFRRAAVIALPYRECDQSGVLMTAIGFDKPIIASRVGGIPEILRDGVHAFLVEPEDPEALTKALDRVLGSSAIARSMGKAIGLLRTEELSWESVARKTISIYEKLIRQAGG